MKPDYNKFKTKFKAGNPGDSYNVFPKRNTRNSVSNKIRNICNEIKARIRKEENPEKKAMWATIGLEFNDILMEWG
jgi:predicted transcriptional regulator